MPKRKKKRPQQQPKTKQVDCPQCGRSQPIQGPDTIYFCDSCNGQFDADGDDGGDYYTDPTKRLEKADERRVVIRQLSHRKR